jgi:serine-type D-Ala-D-Ala carboxypeptidase (penicillin-binding protein 5/6)
MRRAAAWSFAVLAALAVSAAGAAPPTGPSDPFPKAAASYLVAVDGSVLWERAAGVARRPASLTKIMTALVVLEKGYESGAVVEVSAAAAAESGTRIGLKRGDRVAAGDLLNAMLVGSANDACLALAEHAGGSVKAFVNLMNARAAALGLKATHFEDPCGHDRAGQVSSARDLWRLAEAAIDKPEFARAVALERATVRTAAGRELAVETSNKLLGNLPGAKGVKTGYTAKAGKCVVALAERDGHRVLAVLLDSPDRWWTAAALVERAFEAARAGH